MKKPAIGQTLINGSKYIRVVAPAGFNGIADRKAYYFSTKNAADELRWKIKRVKAEKKAPTVTLDFDKDDQRWAAFLHARLGPDLTLLPVIIDHWERTKKAIRSERTVAELADEYLAYRKNRPGMNAKTLSDVRCRIVRMKGEFGDREVSSLSAQDIRSFLNHHQSGTNQRNDYKALSPMFKYAIENRYLILSPLAEIKRPTQDRSEPEILTPADFSKLLNGAEPDLLPFLAIAGFSGMRTAELLQERKADQVLQWSDIDWGSKRICVRPEVAKETARGSDRRYPTMVPALMHWLEPLRKKDGKVVTLSQSAFRRRMAALCSRIEVKIGKNALRHSYASYWISRNPKAGFGALAREMGNSESIAKRHYVQTLTPVDGKKWFGLRRS